ncbi:MAG: S-adenosylmethionine decarboxylase [Bacilli bacterium]|nr:S-adenosylmethionine decarboxylase [Bacilli bacterium]
MERYNVINHLFYDGYDLDNELLSNSSFVRELLETVNAKIFDNKGMITLIPYFEGKIRNDGGVSGIILGDNFHFTCHTFSFKNTVFVDYFGDESRKANLENIILTTFNTKNYDMGSKDVHGNFGKHIIFKTKPLSLTDAIMIVKLLLEKINMTPISELLVNEKDNNNFDVVQLIAESHISIHRSDDDVTVDVFSCKYFDINKVLELFDLLDDYIEVNRGIKYVI